MTDAVRQPAQTPESALPPGAVLLGHVGGAFVSQSIYVAAKLGIADLLSDGPHSTEYLAVATGTDAHSLYRVLRCLASSGIFVETGDRIFENTTESEVLRNDHPGSLRELAVWLLEPRHWNVYAELMHSVKTGETAWDRVLGEPVFETLFERDREFGEIFNRAMTSISRLTIPAILDAYDFSKAKVIADVAGGYGHLLGAILQANQGASGILFEIAPVLEGAPNMMESYGVSDRVTYVPGDFTTSIPVEADIYLLKHIIHDWYDDKNRKILGNIRDVMPDDAKILIIDAVIPEGNGPHFGKVIDLEMLMTPGGMERTAKEFETLIASAVLKLQEIIPTQSPVSIVVAAKH